MERITVVYTKRKLRNNVCIVLLVLDTEKYLKIPAFSFSWKPHSNGSGSAIISRTHRKNSSS